MDRATQPPSVVTVSHVQQHLLRAVTETSDETLFACEEEACGRRLVVNRRTRSMTVLDQGDFAALHSGNTLGVPFSMNTSI